MIAGTDNYLNMPVEATAVVGAALGFVSLMLVFFLYVSRKWCFNSTGLACCDEPLPIKTPAACKGIARGKSCDEPHSSSDSDEEVLRRLRQSATQCNLQTTHIPSYSSTYGGPQETYRPLVMSRSHSSNVTTPTSGRNSAHQRTPSDDQSHLISMAERGRVGASSNSSCSSTNSSVEGGTSNESNARLVRKHNHKNNGGFKTRHQVHHEHQERALIASPSSGSEKLRETRIDSAADVGPKYHRLPPQDSIDSVGDFNSNQDCIVILSQEPLYDTMDDIKSLDDPASPRLTHLGLLDHGEEQGDTASELMSRCGVLEIALLYDAPLRKMTVHLLQATGIPTRDRGQPTHTQVRLLMLPSKKQKHKSKIRSGENPQFMECFLLHRVNPEEVNSMGLRVRVYGCERMRRERLIGEAVVSFATINLELENNLWLCLEPRASTTLRGSLGAAGRLAGVGGAMSGADVLSLARSDSTGSTTSMQHGGVPELLLGLAYNGTTGRLTVEVVKGSHFRNLTLNKAPDTYVKLCLVSSTGQEMARSKTTTRRGQPNPLFKETFMFQVALFQLNEVTLMVSVYSKRNMKRNEMVGWFSLGLNSSGPEENAHWTDMRDTRSEPLSRWHVLVDS